MLTKEERGSPSSAQNRLGAPGEMLTACEQGWPLLFAPRGVDADLERHTLAQGDELRVSAQL